MGADPTDTAGEVVAAFAGRRVDPADAPAWFAATEVPLVRERIRAFLRSRNISAIVSSAACGADLLALEVAGQLGLRRRVVLPFAPERFRETSVADRGEGWGALYDRLLPAVADAGDLVVLEDAGEGTEAYARANRAILDEAQHLAAAEEGERYVVAVIVWDGAERGPEDLTVHFAREAKSRGFRTFEILTR